MVSVTYLDKKLIEAGTFHTLQNGTTTLTIEFEGDKFRVEFIVTEDKFQKANMVEGEIVRPDTLQMRLINFRNRLGVPIGPDMLGSVSGRKLYMILYIASLGPSPSKEISYSFYVDGDNNA